MQKLRKENKMPMTPDKVVKELEKLTVLGCESPNVYPAEYVTHDMALDAEDRSLEGQLYRPESAEPCGSCQNCRTVQIANFAISLLQDYQKLRERVSVEKILKIIEDNLECKDDDVIGCHINGKNASAQAIVTYLQQPTEH